MDRWKYKSESLQELETLREISSEKKSNLEEKEKFLNDQIADNKQLQMSIKQLEKKLAAIQEKQRNVAEGISTYTVEVKSTKYFKITNHF